MFPARRPALVEVLLLLFPLLPLLLLLLLLLLLPLLLLLSLLLLPSRTSWTRSSASMSSKSSAARAPFLALVLAGIIVAHVTFSKRKRHKISIRENIFLKCVRVRSSCENGKKEEEIR
jgi:hypothetical protein